MGSKLILVAQESAFNLSFLHKRVKMLHQHQIWNTVCLAQGHFSWTVTSSSSSLPLIGKKKKKACCAFSPPVSVSGARTAPATGPPTPAAVHPAPRGRRRRRGRGGWPTTLFLLPLAPAVILTVRRAPTHAGWQSAGITHKSRVNLLTS